MCLFVNNIWCTISNIKGFSRHCSSEVEYLMISCRPHYLSRKLSSIILHSHLFTITNRCWHKDHTQPAVYAISKQENAHPEASLLVAGDFNAGKLKSVLPNFYQHVTCLTRGKNTPDHLYSTHRDAYKALSCHSFGKSDHTFILLIPA